MSPQLTINRRPVQRVDVGRLPSVEREGETVTVRVPWAMLGFGDPSSHTVVTRRAGGRVETEKAGAITIASAGETLDYDWDDWTSVHWRERRKAGWDAVARAFAETAR